MASRRKVANTLSGLPAEAARTDGMQSFWLVFNGDHDHPVTGESLLGRYVRIVAPSRTVALRRVWSCFGDGWQTLFNSYDEFMKCVGGRRYMELPPENEQFKLEYLQDVRDNVLDGMRF